MDQQNVNHPAATPMVSVIMNCYNSQKYLAPAIDSVYRQTFGDWEIIFWDNCSTDNSAAIAKARDHRLRYHRSAQTVPLGRARNLAIEKARGKYLAFLDCDDLWEPAKLQKQVALMESRPEAGLIFSDALFFFENGKSFRLFPRQKPLTGKIFRELLRRYVLPMPTIMIRREVLGRVGGGFDDRFNMVEDADLFLRIAYYYPVEYVDEVLAQRRMHDQSWTATKKELFPREEELLLEKFSALWPSFSKEFASEIAAMNAMIQYQFAVLDWEQGKNAAARQRIAPYRNCVRKLWVPFLFTYLPYPVYRIFKRGYKNLTAPWVGSVDYQAF